MFHEKNRSRAPFLMIKPQEPMTGHYSLVELMICVAKLHLFLRSVLRPGVLKEKFPQAFMQIG